MFVDHWAAGWIATTFCTEMYTLLGVFHKNTSKSLAESDYSVKELLE